MRYLKEYNQHLGWSKITSQQYHQYYQERLGDYFNWKELQYLLKIISGLALKGENTKYFGVNFRLEFGHGYLGGNDESVIYIKRDHYVFYQIDKVDDEWFYLVDMAKPDKGEHRSYFRCDQFSGLVSCLEERIKLLE